MVKKDNRFLIFCPKGVRTGGPEALHQLAYTLIQLERDAYIVYYGNQIENDAYPEYKIPKIRKANAGKFDIAIAPEVSTWLLTQRAYYKKSIYWLSVDNYIKTIQAANRNAKTLNRKSDLLKINHFYFNKSFSVDYHLYQSEYAKIFLLKNLKTRYGKIYPISDYMPIEYRRETEHYIEKKEDLIAFNPKKLGSFGEKVLKNIPQKKLVRLEGMSKDQMLQCLRKCKIYIDFGHHPGKDRIPREAAAAGCLVVVGLRGSAAFYKDVPLADRYKIDMRTENPAVVASDILNMMQDYSSHFGSTKVIRHEAVQSKKNFTEEVQRWIEVESL